MLDCITDENTTILWEPGSSMTPVYYEGVKARIIVTVSPNEKLFHEFNKRAEMLFMPCPSELQIRLMGQVYRRFATYLENCPTDEEIRSIYSNGFVLVNLQNSQVQVFMKKGKRNNC